MSMHGLAVGVLLVMAFSGVVRGVEGQQFISTSAYRVPFNRLDSLQKLLKANKAVTTQVKRLGGVVDDMWLIHSWGGEYTVLQVTTWKSWAAITDTAVGFNAATRRVYPDSVKRKQVNDAFDWVFDGVAHVDNIYLKVE